MKKIYTAVLLFLFSAATVTVLMYNRVNEDEKNFIGQLDGIFEGTTNKAIADTLQSPYSGLRPIMLPKDEKFIEGVFNGSRKPSAYLTTLVGGFKIINLSKVKLDDEESHSFYQLDSIVQGDVFYFGDITDNLKKNFNKNANSFTKSVINAELNKKGLVITPNGYSAISDFPNKRSRYFHIERKLVESRKDIGRNRSYNDQNFNLYLKEYGIVYNMVQDKNMIKKDSFKYFGISFISYAILFFIIFLILKIFKKN